MATHSSTPAWNIPLMEEPGGLPSMGSHRVRHNWSDLAAAAAAYMYLHIFMYIVCTCAQLYPTLCDSMDCSPPGSSVHGIAPTKTSRVLLQRVSRP